MDEKELLKNENKIEKLWLSIKNINSPDIQHLYGILLFKMGKSKKSIENLKIAIETMKNRKGVINQMSELVNNAINIHEHSQTDLDKYCDKPSKYSGDIKI